MAEVVRRGFLAKSPGRGVRHRVAVFELEEEEEDGEEDGEGDGEGDGEEDAAMMEEEQTKEQQQRQQAAAAKPAAAADADDACVRAIRITHVLSQSDVVRFLARHLDRFGPAAGLTLAQLGLARKEARGVVCVPGSMPALNALSALMVRDGGTFVARFCAAASTAARFALFSHSGAHLLTHPQKNQKQNNSRRRSRRSASSTAARWPPASRPRTCAGSCRSASTRSRSPCSST